MSKSIIQTNEKKTTTTTTMSISGGKNIHTVSIFIHIFGMFVYFMHLFNVAKINSLELIFFSQCKFKQKHSTEKNYDQCWKRRKKG